MLPILVKNSPGKGKWKNLMCISLRQWTILFSILIFIITAVITTCTVLGTMHTNTMLELLEEDIQEEHHKYQNFHGISSNEAKLQISHSFVLTITKILQICMWLGWLNLIIAAVLIYGITTNTSIYIIPWILLSGTTYLLGITTIVMGYFNLIPGLYINYTILLICLASFLIFIEMWYTIVLYYISVSRTCSGMTTNNIIHAYGGYRHTIHSNFNKDKQLLV